MSCGGKSCRAVVSELMSDVCWRFPRDFEVVTHILPLDGSGRNS